MMNLGYFYDEGIGTLRSKHEAMRWYKRAFANGDSGAASNIAILFRERGNHHHMFRWFIAAARRDDGDALVEVAKCYQMGLGVPRSTMMTIANARKALRSTRLSLAGREEALGLLRRCSREWPPAAEVAFRPLPAGGASDRFGEARTPTVTAV